MKVYLFYLKLTPENEYECHIPNPRDNYIRINKGVKEMLYGYTKSKELKDIFKETRNMSLFTIDKLDLSYEDYVLLVHDYSDIGHYDIHRLKTKTVVDGFCTVKMQDVYCTEFEYNECISIDPFLLNNDNYDYVINLVDIARKYFNKKYRNIIEEYTGCISYIDNYDDYNLDEFAFDELSIFVKVFSRLYKKGF